MSIRRRDGLTIYDIEDEQSVPSPEVKQTGPNTPTTSPLSSASTSPISPLRAMTQTLTALSDKLNELRRDHSSSNNTLTRAADDDGTEAKRSDVSRVSAGTSSAELPEAVDSPSLSPLSTPPSSPSLAALAETKPSLKIQPHMPSTYPTPADQIDRHAEFEAETSAQRATSRELRDISSDITVEHEAKVTETKMSGGNDGLGPPSESLPSLTPSQMTAPTIPEVPKTPPPEASYSAFAPESSDQATDHASNITSDMANNITPDVKKVANDVQKEDPMNQKAVVEANEATMHKVQTISEVILEKIQASKRVSRAWRHLIY